MHLIAASSELSNDILGKETGITSGYIYVHIFHTYQAVEDRFKLSKQLYLIKQYIIHSIIFNLLFQIWIQHIRITIFLVFKSIKSNLNDVIFIYSL